MPRRRTEPDRSGTAFTIPIATAVGLMRGDSITLDRIIQVAGLEAADEAAFRADCDSPAAWLSAVLAHYDPTERFIAILGAIEGKSVEDLMRGTVRAVLAESQSQRDWLALAALEAERYQGDSLNRLIARLMPMATDVLNRLKATDSLRPIPDWLIARVLASALIGFVASESALPPGLGFAARLMPSRLWADGLTDILLYGLLEDKG